MKNNNPLKGQVPKLTPIKHPWIDKFLKTQNLDLLFEQYGSPINILCNTPFLENHKEFNEVFSSHGIKGEVFFARKANKSQYFVKSALENGFGVDTASYRELQQSLKFPHNTEKLVLTAAIKDTQLLNLAIENNVLIIIDNLDELNATKAIAQEKNKEAQIGLRIGGFTYKNQKLYTRFGFDISDVQEVINQEIINHNNLKLQGFHFHLNGYSISQRAAALKQTLDICKIVQQQQINIQFIDIGGGITINYLESEAEWNKFKSTLKESLQQDTPAITHQKNGLGYFIENGQLKGQLQTYPYFNKQPRKVFMDELLKSEFDGISLSEALIKQNISLRIEPGRSLLDQAGITLAQVIFRKYDSNGDLLIGLNMNGTQLFSASADFLLDPIVISSSGHETKKATTGYFVGARCLESDVILKRKINLDQIPEIGDTVCFINTAGYMMHFYETEAHLFELSKNLIYEENSNNISNSEA